MSDDTNWEQHYLAHDTGWDLGEPAPPLVRAFGTLPITRAVVVGSGLGNDALALAALGFDVTGVDLAPSAVKLATEAAAQRKRRAVFVLEDILALPGKHAAWPLWVEHTCFCAIDPSQRDAYVEAAHRSLAPGGLLLGLFYAHTRPGGPPFSTTREELLKRFSPRFELESMEIPTDSHTRRRGEELLARFRRR